MICRLVIVFILLFGLASGVSAQNYILLGSDSQGDAKFGGLDMKSLYYAVDKVQDSLWFKIVTYNAHGGDLGFAIGLDNDNNLQNGHAWGGTNTSMKYDLIVFIDRDVVDTTVVYGGVDTTAEHPINAHFAPRVLDSKTVEVNLKLSEIAPSGVLHVIAGSGAFDISSVPDIYDDLPNTNHLTIDLNAGIQTEQRGSASLFSCYPNPFSQFATISLSPATSGHADISIVNLLGTEVAHIFSGELEAGEHSFTWVADKNVCVAGVYECVVRMNGTVETRPIVLAR